jgi:hypothetical protein
MKNVRENNGQVLALSETTKREEHHHDYQYLSLITVIIYALYWLRFLTFKLL